MVFGRILDLVRGEPQLSPGPIHLPEYFPVEPIGCEKQTAALFKCLAEDATTNIRAMETAGKSPSYYASMNDEFRDSTSTTTTTTEPSLKTTTTTTADSPPISEDKNKTMAIGNNNSNDDPLEPCRSFIAHYQRCCDRQLKRKVNWKLLEPYRVQEEYRYEAKDQTTTTTTTAKDEQ